jgi:predicted nuclease with TOPRIM domain
MNQDFQDLRRLCLKLARQVANLQDDNTMLSERNQMLAEEVHAQRKEIQQLQTALQAAESGAMVAQFVDDPTALRKQLDEMLAEVNHCLKLLSD